MPTVSDYRSLITSWHASRPKFVAAVEANVTPQTELQAAIRSLIDAFDLDLAIGAQLDILGQWIGRSRRVAIPLQDTWFALDDAKRGFDKGVWKGPYDTGAGVSRLDDTNYRRLLRAKIFFNHWDGATASAETALIAYFASRDSHIFVEDRQDMSIAVCFTAKRPSLLDLLIVSLGYIPVKPTGVKTYYQVTSIDQTPLFGFDTGSADVSGLDIGSWGVTPEYIAHNL